MARNVRLLKCTPDDVFRVLADGWLYPSWVVGASRMRDVDDTWPESGRLHHSVGVWPLLIDDISEVQAWEPPHRMVLRAHGWPVGTASVVIDVKPVGEGATLVRIQEEPRSGPARFIPRPISDLLLRWRNAETLHRLAYLAEGVSVVEAGPTTAEEEGD